MVGVLQREAKRGKKAAWIIVSTHNVHERMPPILKEEKPTGAQTFIQDFG